MVKLVTIACLVGIILATPGCCGCWSCGKNDSCGAKAPKKEVVKKVKKAPKPMQKEAM